MVSSAKKRLVVPRPRNLAARSLRRKRLSGTVWATASGAIALGAAVFLGFSGVMSTAVAPPSLVPYDTSVNPSVAACFTPTQACGEVIVRIIEHATSEIRVQAYGFTATPILDALCEARRRGVDVAVILDKSDELSRSGRAGAEAVAKAGIPVFIDYRPSIAHNKLIIVDRRIVITGSYNFTAAAETRNAENVTVINSARIAQNFLSNWKARRGISRSFEVDGGG